VESDEGEAIYYAQLVLSSKFAAGAINGGMFFEERGSSTIKAAIRVARSV
jgi:hypothetical protein